MAKKIALLFALLFVLGITGYAQDEDATADATEEVDTTADSDFDGMPDWWEDEHGFVTRRDMGAEARRDNDGDLIKNISEFSNATDPNDASDNDGDGIPDDYETHYGFDDPDGDLDGDDISNLQEYEDRTDPSDAEDFLEQETTIESDERGTPSMEGVTENKDESLLENNHEVSPGIFVFKDPIGDDKGPGYYEYPTLSVYPSGAFDILEFKVDTTDPNNITFEITINADVKQDWGMAADFDVQHFQIYIDMDREAGSGATGSEGGVVTLPGLNTFISPFDGWDRMVIITPQPKSRVQVELDAKVEEDLVESCIIPAKISASGRTITAVVTKKDLLGSLASDEEYDFSVWAYQLFAQSNEGYPDPEDVLTRNVNEYKGMHRFGGGSDYWGDPEIMDILVYPAIGSLEEAENQFEILNVWSSYPDPTLDVKAVVPMVAPDQDELWEPDEGYEEYAIALAEKIAPPAQKDKYVSDSFSLSTKVFTRWNWNLDPSQQNFMKNSLEVQFFGKTFTDKVDYYMRWEIQKWDNTVWTQWQNDTPGQQPVVLQSFRGILVNPLPTIDTISIGNYELDYNPWVMGSAWYPDRDKFKGFFVDGSVESYLNYNFTAHYPLNWIGLDWDHGSFKAQDFAYGLKLTSSYISGLDLEVTSAFYTDFEVSPLSSTNYEPAKYILRGYNLGVVGDVNYKLDLGFATFNIGGLFAYTDFGLGEDFKSLEVGTETDIDGNGYLGQLTPVADGGGQITPVQGTNGMAVVGTLSLDNMFEALSFTAQGFYVSHNYTAIGAARGDTSILASGFAGSPTADILEMAGNQSVHRFPQAADFVSDVPIPGLPTKFLLPDPVTSIATIGWINDNWEGIAALGWTGATGILEANLDVLRLSGEFSYIQFNNPDYTNTSQMRAYISGEYSIISIDASISLFGKFYKLDDDRDMTAKRDAMLIAPGISYDQQLTKVINSTLSYKLELGNYQETGDFADADYTNAASFTRHRIGLDLNYSLPVGYITILGEYWFEPATANDFSGRAPYGAYAITEWEFAF